MGRSDLRSVELRDRARREQLATIRADAADATEPGSVHAADAIKPGSVLPSEGGGRGFRPARSPSLRGTVPARAR
jgi:hypothetical protein